MLVTPIKKSVGKHKPGDVFELPDKKAMLFIKIGILRAAEVGAEISERTGLPKRQYRRRDMQAES
jgi:hypothetical protein